MSRVSLGSADALKNTIVQLATQSETTLQRMFHIVNAGNTFGDDMSKRIADWLKVKSNPDFSKVNTGITNAEKLVPPGRIFHVYKESPSYYVMEESDHQLFTEIIIAKDMARDHFPINYEARWNMLTSNEDFWKNRIGLEMNELSKSKVEQESGDESLNYFVNEDTV